jgi:hypothetical protein
LDEIPLPYSITAYRWYEGIDIRTEPVTLRVLSRSTFYRHRKNLLEYGIDIGKKCNVKVIHYKRRRFFGGSPYLETFEPLPNEPILVNLFNPKLVFRYASIDAL